jgi:uncharacterized protein YnzC (UPF0291/DUF896 family)
MVKEKINMMNEEKIKRINDLYAKSKNAVLTEEEKKEQLELRKEFLKNVRGQLKGQLSNIKFVDEKGTVVKDLSKIKVN